MKRKIKLIVSIASLTLSMALIMFGVYAAASTRQAEISGTISFTTSNVQATVLVFEYFGTAPAELGETQCVGQKQFTTSEQGGLEVTLGTKVGGTGGTIPMNDSVTTYTFVISITNNFNSGSITVNLLVAPSVSGNAALSMESTTTPTTAPTPIAAGETSLWTYKITVNPSMMTSSSFTKALTAVFELSNTPA